MKIVALETKRLMTPLKKTFKTAIRTVTAAESVIVLIHCDDGTTGFGGAAATPVITGESLSSIEEAVLNIIGPQLIGEDIRQKARIARKIDGVVRHNTSACAAVNMAIYDCLAKKANLPLYQLLGGYSNQLKTDLTVSVNAPEEMIADAKQYIREGFDTLKIKVGGGSIAEDIERVSIIRQAVGESVKLRLDANQSWSEKEAIAAIRQMEADGLAIELVEQPLPAWDFEGMKRVTQSVLTPIMADESVFSVQDAAKLLAIHGCDIINIKLMKTGGIDEALKINALAESFGVNCMIGCMIESSVSLSAAIHFAAALPNVTRCDLDAALMFRSDPVISGIRYEKDQILLSSDPGLGIQKVIFD